ncbi:MAG: CHAD domain-containing protein [Bacteroidia bacterium]
MKNDNLGKHLSKYYKKELTLFSKHLDSAKALPDEKNIHQLRVDIKRLRAIFRLLEMLFPKKFNAGKHSAVLKPVFKSAGEFREIQVNLAYLSQYKLPLHADKLYKQFLRKTERKILKKFKKTVGDFDMAGSDKAKNEIKKLCNATRGEKIRENCLLFIQKEAVRIENLSMAGDNPVIIHKIRMHLKSLDAIVSLFYKMNPDKKLNELLSHIKQSGEMIGTWHDKIMLVKSLEIFLIKFENLKSADLMALIKLLNKIKTEQQFFFLKMNKGIIPILKTVHGMKEFKTPI